MTQVARSFWKGLKLARADEHLDILNAEIATWMSRNPSSFSHHVNSDATQHAYRLRFDPAPDLIRWSMLLGDGIHNLRCALDHVIYDLASRHERVRPPRAATQLAFPLCSTPEAFTKSRWRIKSLPRPVQAVIEQAQPYNRVRKDGFAPLLTLAILDDMDKHRTPMISPVAHALDTIALPAGVRRGLVRAQLDQSAVLDGAPVVRITFDRPTPEPNMTLKLVGTVVMPLTGFDRPPSVWYVTNMMRGDVAEVYRLLAMFR